MRMQHLMIFLAFFSFVDVVFGKKPNFVLFYADDFGYGDLSSYGHPTQEYGFIDKLAREGARFTHWYSPDTYCTPSRSALLTGRLPLRVGLIGQERVFLPDHTTGFPKNETTIAESLKTAGYSTGIVGKWHLGINEFSNSDGRHLPSNHGFDFVGTILPFSLTWHCDDYKRHRSSPLRAHSFLYYNKTIIEQPIITKRLTEKLVRDAKAFIYDNEEKPFFLYFPLPHTHTPMFASTRFNGSSKRGPYGDMVNEMHWAVEQVVNTVKLLNLQENTLVIFVSDHGPQMEACNEGGSPGRFRGGKTTFYEGGIRVPAIAWWPGVIKPGTVSSSIISTMDLFPTFNELAGIEHKSERIFDGHSIAEEFLYGKSVSHENLFFYCDKDLVAVRHNKYKIHFKSHTIMEETDLRSTNCPKGTPQELLFLDNEPFYSTTEACKHMNDHGDHPLVFNLNEDPFELYPFPESPEKEEIIKAVRVIIAEHTATIDPGIPLLLNLSYRKSSVIPCCNPPYCFCREHQSSMCFI